MRVQILINLGSQDFPGHPFMDGECHDCDEALAVRLIKRGFAEEVKAAPPAESASDKYQKLRKAIGRHEQASQPDQEK